MKPYITNIDEQRHIKLYQLLGPNKPEERFKLEELNNLLDFENEEELFYWIARESIRFQNESAHNFIKVGSPHNHLLAYLVKYLDKNYNNVISDVIKNQREKINLDLSGWIEHINFLEKCRCSRKLESERKEKEIHDEAVKRKTEKATQDIFKAVRRKDVNAIISLRIKGADLNFKNESGFTVLEYAKQIGDEKIINALLNDINNLNS